MKSKVYVIVDTSMDCYDCIDGFDSVYGTREEADERSKGREYLYVEEETITIKEGLNEKHTSN